MDKIEEILNKLGDVKKLAETVRNLAYSCDEKGKADIQRVDETTRQAVYELAETLGQYEHSRLIVALAASHAAKYGEDYLPEKVLTWLQRHEWVRTVAIAILTLIAAWGLNSCASSMKQTSTAADGTITTTERVLILNGNEARDILKLYPIPTVNINGK